MAPLFVLVHLLILANFFLLPISAHIIPTPKLFGRTAIAALKERHVPARGSSASVVKRESAGINLTPAKRQTASGQCGPDKGVCGAGICCSPEGNCGLGPEYCNSPDCQIDYGSGCDGLKTPAGASTLGMARPQVGSIPYGGSGVYDCLIAGTVALTFDDGPGIYTSDILDILDTYNAKATFFITGINNGKGEIDNTSLPWAALIKRMYASGHQIASHTWSHQDLSTINAQQRQDQIIKNEMALRNILGFFPTYMRPPYSDCTVTSGCEATLNTLGYHIVYFDVDTDDYDNDSPLLIQNSKNNFNNAFAGHPAASNDFLVIAHDIHEQTVHNLTAYMLQALLAQGFKPVTLGQCLGDPAANWYRSVSGAVTVSPVSATTSAVTSVTTSTTTSASGTTKTTTAAKAASTDGSCGIAATQFTCIASQFGNCCSQYGWCGSTAAYCGPGCQAGGGAGTCT